jgi:ribose-phosphate pyrophosphokinase
LGYLFIMKLFSGSSNGLLAKRIALGLGMEVSPVEIFVFPDGERRVQVQESVVDEHVVVVQSTSTPVDQNYMELFFLADAAKRSGAALIVAVVPYLGYQRQDHVFRDGEAVSLEVVVKTLQAVGIDRLIAFDFHSVKIPGVFRIPVSHLSALSLFAKEIEERGWKNSDSVLVTPDMGGIRRIRMLSEMLGGMEYVAVEKDRDLVTGHVEAVRIETQNLASLQGKRALIVDDMISSGKTMVKAAELLVKHGVESVTIFATHPVFSDEASELLQESMVDKVFVTDSVFVPEGKRFEKLQILSVAGMVAEELKSLRVK